MGTPHLDSIEVRDGRTHIFSIICLGVIHLPAVPIPWEETFDGPIALGETLSSEAGQRKGRTGFRNWTSGLGEGSQVVISLCLPLFSDHIDLF